MSADQSVDQDAIDSINECLEAIGMPGDRECSAIVDRLDGATAKKAAAAAAADYTVHGGLPGANPEPASEHDPVVAVARHQGPGFDYQPTGERGELAPWKWGVSHLTWSLAHTLHGADMGWPDVHAVAEACFAAVSRACNLSFTAVAKTHNPSDADIRIVILKEQDYAPFRANKKILGLGWFPSPTNPAEGRIILNGSYRWGQGEAAPDAAHLEDDEYVTRNTVILQHVLLHEIGHTLGLPHASTGCPDCVMAPVYSARPSSGAWHGEDAERLRALYGAPQAPAS